MSSFRVCALFGLVIFAASCGSTGGGGSISGGGPATVVMTEYYDAPTNTQIKAQGPVLVGTTTKQGAWTTWFPSAEGGGIQFEQTWVSGTADLNQPWSERNADGSFRDTSADE